MCDWITEVFFSNSKMIKWSFPVVFISLIHRLIFSIPYLAVQHQVPVFKTLGAICAIIYVVIGTAGSGMFESNAFQFGMDQMLEASSEQLRSFIHCYFWCAHIGPFVVFDLLSGIIMFLQDCTAQWDHAHKKIFMFILTYSIFQMLFSIPSFIYIYCSEKCLLNDQRSKKFHSLKNICRVLRYSWTHKTPELRSALTYWENNIPSRIDLGKDKYGGPFSYEQVEDVKNFFKLLLLILSLFGYQLSGDGYSLTHYIMNTSG